MSQWQAWIGREDRREDRIDPGHFARWCATLDRDAPQDGTVPQGFHWCLGLPDAPSARLGPDGHPRRDDSPDSFLPPVPLPRRMWASSKVEFLAPLRAGEAVSRTSRVLSIAEKSGGTGSLVRGLVKLFEDIGGQVRTVARGEEVERGGVMQHHMLINH